MAKVEKKSIAELVALRTKKPSLDQIDQITQNIHTTKVETVQSKSVEATEPVVAKAVETPVAVADIKQTDSITEKNSPKPKAEKTVKVTEKTSKKNLTAEEEDFDDRIKRISVHAPIGLYIQARTKATLKNMTMMAYILKLMEEDLKR